MAINKTLRVRQKAGWETKPRIDDPSYALVAEEVDDNFLALEENIELLQQREEFFSNNTYESLRAKGTTQADVGLANVRNVASWSQSEADSRYLQDAPSDGNQYVRKDQTWTISNPFNPNGDYTSLRAKGTTQADVGLANVRNVASWSQSEADSRYLQKSNNLSDLDSISLARANLSVNNVRNVSSWSQGEADSRFATRRDWNDGNEAGHIYAHDTRDLPNSLSNSSYIPDPIDLPSYSISAIFSRGFSGYSWRTGIVVKGWRTGDYSAWAISGPASTSYDNKWFLRSGAGTSWSSDYEIQHSGNIIGTNAEGTRSVSTNSPSGGSNGDIWYKV